MMAASYQGQDSRLLPLTAFDEVDRMTRGDLFIYSESPTLTDTQGCLVEGHAETVRAVCSQLPRRLAAKSGGCLQPRPHCGRA